jgi:hypothetical protein
MRMQTQTPHPVAGYGRRLAGRDAHGCKLVGDREGLVGGLFPDRASAVSALVAVAVWLAMLAISLGS